MKVLLYDFRWKNEQCCEFTASVGDNFGRKSVICGDQISFQICSDVRCAGSVFEDEFKPCPQSFIGKSKCDICRAREKSFVFTSFDGFNRENFSETDLARLDGYHVVYLAFFTQDLIKVGVSKLERKILRQIEQGAHYTLFIAKTPDGIVARQIETLIRQAGVADKIKPSQKKEFLIPEFPPKVSEELLKKIVTEKKEFFGNHFHLHEFFISPEFYDWTEIYGLNEVSTSKKPLHPIKLENGESLSGKILAIKGQFLMIETSDEIFAVCAKDLFGREIDFSEKPNGLIQNTARQKTMF